MKELIDQCFEIRERCRKYGDELEATGIEPGRACFSMLFNCATQTAEVLHCYSQQWQVAPPGISNERKKEMQEENGQRCIMITRDVLFVHGLSAIEFCLKNRVRDLKHSKNLSGCLKRRIGVFRCVLRESASLLGADQVKVWTYALDLRNAIVHNNGYGMMNSTVDLAGRRFEMKEGKMTQGDLDTFTYFIDHLLESLRDWFLLLGKSVS